MTHYTPRTLAEAWVSTTEHVLGLVHSGQLEAFSISKPGSKRPRFRITLEAVAEFERQHSNRPQPTAKPQSTRKRMRSRVAFYTNPPGPAAEMSHLKLPD